MIILDIETTGLSPTKNSMVSLGAIGFKTNEQFYMECHAYPDREIDEYALKVNGFTREQCLDVSKPGAEHVYNEFVKWANFNYGDTKHLLGGQQIGTFDVTFLYVIAGGKSEFEKHFSYRTVDLHSVAYAKFGESLSLDGILKALGLDPEVKPHNALTGARLEAKCFELLVTNV